VYKNFGFKLSIPFFISHNGYKSAFRLLLLNSLLMTSVPELVSILCVCQFPIFSNRPQKMYAHFFAESWGRKKWKNNASTAKAPVALRHLFRVCHAIETGI